MHSSLVLRRINGFTHLNLTKLDVLSDLDTIQLGVAYRGPDGRILPSMPADIRDLEAVEVVYEQLPGWRQDISGARSWDELPPNAKKYIRCVRRVQEAWRCCCRAADWAVTESCERKSSVHRGRSCKPHPDDVAILHCAGE
jgi:hypothetical protein